MAPAEAFRLIRSLTDDLDFLSSKLPQASTDLANWFKGIRSIKNSNQIQMFKGLLYELTVARHAIDKIKKGDEVVRVAFRHTSLKSGSVDTMVGRLIVEAKRGASASDPAKLKQLQERVVRQLKRVHASGLADKVRYIVPDKKTADLLREHLEKGLHEAKNKKVLEAFIEFDIVPSHFKT